MPRNNYFIRGIFFRKRKTKSYLILGNDKISVSIETLDILERREKTPHPYFNQRLPVPRLASSKKKKEKFYVVPPLFITSDNSTGIGKGAKTSRIK